MFGISLLKGGTSCLFDLRPRSDIKARGEIMLTTSLWIGWKSILNGTRCRLKLRFNSFANEIEDEVDQRQRRFLRSFRPGWQKRVYGKQLVVLI